MESDCLDGLVEFEPDDAPGKYSYDRAAASQRSESVRRELGPLAENRAERNQAKRATISKRLLLPVEKIDTSLCVPPSLAGWPFTVMLCSVFSFGRRNFTCNSFGAPGLASRTFAVTRFLLASATILKFTLPQRVGA